jgi:hypothetical protein
MGAAALEARGRIMGMGICRRSVVAVAGLAFLALAGPATSVWAGAITDSATNADNLIAEGKASDALAAFDQATDAFWAGSPLQFRVASFATSVKGFGQYEPVTDARFRAGDTATVYLEPVGYGFTAAGETSTVAFTTALEIQTAGGILLAKADNFGNMEWQGRSKSRQVPAIVEITLPALKPGDYRLMLTLTDAASAKHASVTLPFAIAE